MSVVSLACHFFIVAKNTLEGLAVNLTVGAR
jgi:hypothetical protein